MLRNLVKQLEDRIQNTELRILTSIFVFSFFFLLSSFFSTSAQAAPAAGINRTFNFQGKVVLKSDGTNLPTTTYPFVFKLYDDPTAGNQLPTGTPWSETQTLTVTDGIFRATLGSSTSIPATVDFNSDTIYLSITFNGELFSSRVRLTAVPYAFNSEKVGGLTVTNTTGTLTIPSATTVTFSGANNLTFTTTNITNATLPAGTITLVDTATAQSLTNKTIGSTGLIFSGAATDITTVSNEDFSIMPNGTGKVGIGTTNPSATLEVNNNSALAIKTNGWIQATSGFYVGGSTSSGINGATSLRFRSNGTDDRMILDTNGNVGIGTTSPAAKLDLVGGSMLIDNAQYYRGRDSGGTSRSLLGINASDVVTVGTSGMATSDTQILAGGVTAVTIKNTSGNVGIGTTSPIGKLSVSKYGSQGGAGLIVGGASGIIGESNLYIGMLQNSYASIYADKYGTSFLPLVLQTDGNGLSAGNVGIGTTAPGANLDVAGGGINIQRSSAQPYIKFTYDTTAVAQVRGVNGGGLRISAGNDATGWMQFDSSGNVGIGTTGPGAPLHISTTSNPAAFFDVFGSVGTASIQFRQAQGTASSPTASQLDNQLFSFNGKGYGATGYSGTARVYIRGLASENWTDSAQGTYLAFATAANGSITTGERMRIDNAGNVGIGTTNPASKLELAASSSGSMAHALRLSNSAFSTNFKAGEGAYMSFTDGFNENVMATIGGGSLVNNNGSHGFLAFSTRGNRPGEAVWESMRIDDAGNVGIGTTAPTSRLQVAGIQASPPSIAYLVSTGNAAFTINTRSDSTTRLSFFETADANEYPVLQGYEVTGSAAKPLILNPYGGNVGIGTVSPGYKLTVNGQPGANGYTAFTNYSDARLKTNINSLNIGYLDKIMALNPSTFNYNDLSGYDAETQSRTITGFIAQEIQTIFPEMVGKTTINGTEYLDTNLSALPIYIVKAIQEQQLSIFASNTFIASTSAGLAHLSLSASGDIANLKSEVSGLQGASVQMSQLELLELSVASQGARLASLGAKITSLEAGLVVSSESAQLTLINQFDNNIVSSSSGLTLMGKTAAYSLSIIDKLTLGLLTIESDASASGSIQTALVPLKLQKDSLGNLEIMGSKIVIDTWGNLVAKEAITARELKTTRLTILDVKDATSGATLGSSAGKAELAAGDTALLVHVAGLTDTSLIFVTPENKAVAVAAKKKDEATIELSIAAPLSEALKVNWWIIN